MQKCAKKLYILEVSYGEEPGTFEHVNTGKIRISGGLRGGVGNGSWAAVEKEGVVVAHGAGKRGSCGAGNWRREAMRGYYRPWRIVRRG